MKGLESEERWHIALYLAVAALALTLAFSTCSNAASIVPVSGPTHAAIVFGGGVRNRTETLHVYESKTDAQKQQGLMGLRSLPEDVGMVFEWTEPTTTGFWMKDTLIPLSVAFVGADGKIVSIQEMTPCTADPCHIYTSPEPYLMAIEANAGWFSQRFIGVGQTARLEIQPCNNPNSVASCVAQNG